MKESFDSGRRAQLFQDLAQNRDNEPYRELQLRTSKSESERGDDKWQNTQVRADKLYWGRDGGCRELLVWDSALSEITTDYKWFWDMSKLPKLS